MTDKQKLPRRSFVALGATGVATLALGGIAGCGNKSEPDINNAPVRDEAPRQDELALEPAQADWEAAHMDATSYFNNLQDTIRYIDVEINNLEGKVVKNPEAVSALEDLLQEAIDTEGKHINMEMPETLEDIEKSTAELEEMTATYMQLSGDMVAALEKIETIEPGIGEFDFTNIEGYSYHISYNMSPTISVDTTEGRPGYVGLYMDFSSCSIKVKNTTSGKKAQGVVLACAPLYKIETFSDIVDDSTSLFATFGELASPTKHSAMIDGRPESYEVIPQYVNPFDSDMPNQSDFSNLGRNIILDIEAGVFNSAGGNAYQGNALEVDETRSLDIIVKEGRGSIEHKVGVGEVNEDYVDRFKQIVGWAITVTNLQLNDDQLIYFVGNADIYNVLASHKTLYTYKPVATK